MKITATFSDGILGALDGRAIGDEFDIVARAKIVGADRALVDVTAHGDEDIKVLDGELEVRLLISRAAIR